SLRPWRQGAIHDAVGRDHACEEQLGDGLDDPGPADAADAEARRRLGELRIVGPQVAADDLEARLERQPVDPYPLDRARGGSVASVNGADPSGVGSRPRRRWCMIGLPTTLSSSTSSEATPAWATSRPTSPRRAARTARVISPAPSGWSMTYETRLMRSSPYRIWGFIWPCEASTEPSARSARWPAIVVEPTSMATPYALSRKPGHAAMIERPPWTASVTFQSPSRSAAW